MKGKQIKQLENDLYMKMIRARSNRDFNLPSGFKQNIDYQEKDYLPLVKNKIGWTENRTNRIMPLQNFGLDLDTISKNRNRSCRKCGKSLKPRKNIHVTDYCDDCFAEGN